MNKSVVRLWVFTGILILFNWFRWETISSRVFVIVVLILIAIFGTKRALKKDTGISFREKRQDLESEVMNIPVLKKKYGKYYTLRIYSGLAIFVISVVLSDVFSENAFLDKLSWFAMVLFFVDGVYLCVVQASSKLKQ